jgi:predicted DNA-binding transcriptional regulator AlpA
MQLVLHMDPPRPTPPPAAIDNPAGQRVARHEVGNKTELAASDEVLTTREVVRITKRHRATLFRWEKSGHFPTKRTFKGGKRGWLRSDVEHWMAGENNPDGGRTNTDVH